MINPTHKQIDALEVAMTISNVDALLVVTTGKVARKALKRIRTAAKVGGNASGVARSFYDLRLARDAEIGIPRRFRTELSVEEYRVLADAKRAAAEV